MVSRIFASGVDLTCFICLQLLQLPSDSESTEFCLTESFLAHCSESEVIVMETANFGRMELGRCVTRNYGYLGCSVNVLGHLDAVCSGQRSCEMSVSDPILVRTKPCPPDFSSYLDATYRCVTVETMQPKVTCRENRYHVIRNGRGFIAGPVPDFSSGGGDGLCVLVFNVPNGQRLNITLIDFSARNPLEPIDYPLAPRGNDDQSRPDTRDDHPSSTTTRAIPPHSPTDRPPKDHSPGGGDLPSSSQFKPVSAVQRVMCHQYAIIREPATGLSVPVCGGGGGGGGGGIQARERHVYLSRSNFVHLQLLTWPQVNSAPTGTHSFGRIHFQPAKYLLRYEVVGCPTYNALPDGAHARYEGDRLIVWCNQSRQSSAAVFTCAGGNWVGDPHNCTSARADLKLSGEEGFSKDLITLPPFGLSLLIIVGVALVVVVYISITIVFIMYIRRRRRRMTRAEINTEPASKPPPETDRCHKAASSPVDPSSLGGRSGGGDHPLLLPPGRMIFRREEEERIPMLDAPPPPPPPPPPPHLILDTTGRGRPSGHVCPACFEAKAAGGGGTPPPVLLGFAVAPSAGGAELADGTMGRHRGRVTGGGPSVPQ